MVSERSTNILGLTPDPNYSAGYQQWVYTPLFRGFNSFYGFYTGAVGYWTKSVSGVLDLHDNNELVTGDALSSSVHLTTLLQQKAEAAIASHTTLFPTSPLFLYYALENNHADGTTAVFEAPAAYMNKCTGLASSNVIYQAYCALTIMADEAIGNTVCALEAAGLASNMLLVVGLGDNGGWKSVEGSNYPYRGAKGSLMQGSVHNRAFIYGSMIPVSRHGSTYEGLVHISDWMPTFLSLASAGAWKAPYSGDTIDGLDVLPAILANDPSPRTEIFHNWAPVKGSGAMQIGGLKLIEGSLTKVGIPLSVFELNGTSPLATCPL